MKYGKPRVVGVNLEMQDYTSGKNTLTTHQGGIHSPGP